MLRCDLCSSAYVIVDEEFNSIFLMKRFDGGWHSKYFNCIKYHKSKIVKIETDLIETSYDYRMPMYFYTTDLDGTVIRWSTRKAKIGKPISIWPKGSTFSIWKNGKYVNEKE